MIEILIKLGVILLICGFLFSLLGLVVMSYQAIKRNRTEANWQRNNALWFRLTGG